MIQMTSCERRKQGSKHAPLLLWLPVTDNEKIKQKNSDGYLFGTHRAESEPARHGGVGTCGSDQTELTDLLITKRTLWTRKHRTPGLMRIILKGATRPDIRTISDEVFNA